MTRRSSTSASASRLLLAILIGGCLLATAGCFRATRFAWTGETSYERLPAASPAPDGVAVEMMDGPQGYGRYQRIEQPIAAWTIPFRVLATPFMLIADVFSPMVGGD